MKKKNVWMIGGAILVCLVLLVYLILNLISPLKKINYKDYQTMFEEKQDFILYLGAKTCSHCQAFKPTLEKIARKYNLDVYYLDVSTLSNDEYAIVKNKTFLTGTPTIVFVKGGVVQSEPRIEGEMSYNAALKLFKQSGFVK